MRSSREARSSPFDGKDTERDPPADVQLVVSELSKRFSPPLPLLRWVVRVAAREPVDALCDVSLSVRRGEVTALLGPNGAGKTTFIKLASGLLEPTHGRVTIGGVDLAESPRVARSRLGLVLSDDRGLYWRMTGRENLEFFGVLAGVPRRVVRARVKDAMREVGLEDTSTLVFGYSSGMRTRLNIARALLPDPPLLLLDEPTRSLDPAARDHVWQLLRRLADSGKAVLISSHDLGLVAQYCDAALVIRKGHATFSGALCDLATNGDRTARVLAQMLAEDR